MAYAVLNGNNSGIFKDRSKMFAPKWGFSGGWAMKYRRRNLSQTDRCYRGNQLMIFKHKIG